MSAERVKRTLRDVRVESEMRSITDIEQALTNECLGVFSAAATTALRWIALPRAGQVI
jgi:hypothetical protein